MVWYLAGIVHFYQTVNNSVCRLSYLDNRLGSVTDSRGEEYAPVAAYRHSLLMGEVDTTVQSTKLAAPTTGPKRRGAKRKLIADGESDAGSFKCQWLICTFFCHSLSS